jgi:hypothetical protein
MVGHAFGEVNARAPPRAEASTVPSGPRDGQGPVQAAIVTRGALPHSDGGPSETGIGGLETVATMKTAAPKPATHGRIVAPLSAPLASKIRLRRTLDAAERRPKVGRPFKAGSATIRASPVA